MDWGHEGVEKDLTKIAEHLIDWAEVASYLELTPTDIHDIREKYQDKPPLQRCDHENRLTYLLIINFIQASSVEDMEE